MKHGDIVYVLKGVEIYEATYRSAHGPWAHRVRRATQSGDIIYYGPVYASRQGAEQAVFLRKLASP